MASPSSQPSLSVRIPYTRMPSSEEVIRQSSLRQSYVPPGKPEGVDFAEPQLSPTQTTAGPRRRSTMTMLRADSQERVSRGGWVPSKAKAVALGAADWIRPHAKEIVVGAVLTGLTAWCIVLTVSVKDIYMVPYCPVPPVPPRS